MNKMKWVSVQDELPDLTGKYLVITIKTKSGLSTIKKIKERRFNSRGAFDLRAGEYIPYWLKGNDIPDMPDEIKDLY